MNNPTQPGFPSGSLGKTLTAEQIVEQRRESILYDLATGHGELTDEVIAELAELEGSDTSTITQLYDAGFGEGGVM